MNRQNESSRVEQPVENTHSEKNIARTPPTTRKKFVEPEISSPVDVLEATTFFQAVDSGPTN